MSPDPQSNIRVFISWNDQTVFAGEDVQCRITFKNVARQPSQTPSSANTERPHQPSPLLGTPRKPTSNSNNGLAPPAPARARGHRSTLSLNVPSPATSTRSRSGTTPWLPPQTPPSSGRPAHTHQRSLSIVSIGSAAAAEEQLHNNAGHGHGHGHGQTPGHGQTQRPARGHGRSASLQISPRAGPLQNGGPHSAALPQRPYSSQASPVFNSNSFPPATPSRPTLGRPSTMPSSPGAASQSSWKTQVPEFKFPMARSPLSAPGIGDASPGAPEIVEFPSRPVSAATSTMNYPIRSKDPIPSITEHPIAPAARILASNSGLGGTPRSSGEFYSMSNNSSETLASEYPMQPLRNGAKLSHLRRSSNMSSMGQMNAPETLMMGYAQVQGSFTLDGSLINLGPFEQVKRKAVLGGQGGGVIGLNQAKRDSGLLQSFGWGSWGNSIGELLGGGELSSIKDMRGVASSKSIPLLSTPHSVLFVDLQLAPGDSKTYDYSFKLPRGLPPTHRGKAMKINYSLVIGTQRPGGSKEQQVRTVDIPFRVLGSVNSHGEILGHDLMSPYIILRDLARVQSVDDGMCSMQVQKKGKQHRSNPDSTIDGFLSYVDELLDRPHQGTGLLSPTAGGPSSRRPSFEGASNAKEAIDFAILRSNMTSTETGQSSNRFEIARNGQRVGVVMLGRPAYRLGEAVSVVIDFTDAEIPCYAVHTALETAERVESTLALRSEASVHRVTRKVYGSSSEAALYARRVVFNPTIPISATPEFVTSGLSLEWKIRIEFVVPSSSASEEAEHARQANGPHPLLEELSRDERGGLVLVGAENLDCESFEVAVPLRVYGAVCNGLERLERDEAEDGLAV